MIDASNKLQARVLSGWINMRFCRVKSKISRNRSKANTVIKSLLNSTVKYKPLASDSE